MLEQRHATQPALAIGQRELRALGEVGAPSDESRRREQIDLFMKSEYSQRDDHDARRVGSRHARVRDVSYDEATQRLEETFASDGATYYVVTARQAVQGYFVSCNEL